MTSLSLIFIYYIRIRLTPIPLARIRRKSAIAIDYNRWIQGYPYLIISHNPYILIKI